MSKQLVGMLLVFCVKEEYAKEISEVMTCVAGVGIMGMMVSSTTDMRYSSQSNVLGEQRRRGHSFQILRQHRLYREFTLVCALRESRSSQSGLQ